MKPERTRKRVKGGVFVVYMIGGFFHKKRRPCPELDADWKSASKERLVYLATGPARLTGQDDEGRMHNYAIIGRDQAGEILAVRVQND